MKKRTEGQRRRRWKRRRRRGRGESQVPVPLSHGEMHRKYGLRERQSERGFRSGEREREGERCQDENEKRKSAGGGSSLLEMKTGTKNRIKECSEAA